MNRQVIFSEPTEVPVRSGPWVNYMDGRGWHHEPEGEPKRVELEGYVQTSDDYEGYTIRLADSQEIFDSTDILDYQKQYDVYHNLTDMLTPLPHEPFHDRYEERVRITMEVIE